MNWLFFLTTAVVSFALLWTVYELLHFVLDAALTPDSPEHHHV